VAPQASRLRLVEELNRAIHDFIAETNANPRPFICSKDPDQIVAAVKRAHQEFDSKLA
jgi:hypothetical protein